MFLPMQTKRGNRFQDLTGKKFGRLTVLGLGESLRKVLRWDCRCECGGKALVHGASLKSGNTQSCGCVQRERTGNTSRRHGKSQTKEYSCWSEMRRRVLNPNHKRYGYYGGRGIVICERWSDFASFLTDMGECPKHCWGLGRINNQGNYEPGNVRWETYEQQLNNTRRNKYFAMGDRRQTLTQWCREFGIDPIKTNNLLRKGLPPERAFGKEGLTLCD